MDNMQLRRWRSSRRRPPPARRRRRLRQIELRLENLTDDKDADDPVFAPAYHRRTLTDLDGSGTLTGAYVRVKSNTGKAATARGSATISPWP
jgi:hypothetical protein